MKVRETLTNSKLQSMMRMSSWHIPRSPHSFWSFNMSRLPLRTLDDAPDAAKKGLDLALKANGFLPNLVRLLANAPVALEAYQTVSGINARSGLRLAEREAVQITAAARHGCGFCVAGHTIVAYKRAGLSEDVVNALRNNDHVPDERLNAIAEFTRAIIRSRGNVNDDELTSFRDAGFTDANALEVVLGVSLATLCNFANNLGRSELNPEYLNYAWTNTAAAAAQ
jgi:uncharacterized peroxidase-related enzyme